jgi:APA family basic amino acid/polyamine antiporter
MLGMLFRKKPIVHTSHDSGLHRTLNALDLILMGIGAIIGAGVFVLTGIAAATKAGPGVVLSYVFAGVASMFAALAYAELAASVGGTGSAYGYSYAGFGEFIAWIIGWNLVLEYAMSVATVAIGWSGYVENIFEAMNHPIPTALVKSPFDGGIINLPAVGIIVVICLMLCVGIRHSMRLNTVAVTIKLLTIAAFIAIASTNVKVQNWHNFLPFGWSGVMEGAALVFFAYVGFDALSTAVEETVNPQRNIPIGIIVSLLFCTLIYIVVSLLLTGIEPYASLDLESPVADALLHIGYPFAGGIIAAGAVAGLTTVFLVMYYGLTRISLAMARDGLIPKWLAFINPQTHTPIRIVIISGVIMATVAGFSPIGKAAELVNIGTLTAFVFVCAGVVVLRFTHPDLPRPFKTPFSPIFPILGVMSCLYLIANLSVLTWWRFAIWTFIGIMVYFFYGLRYSALNVEVEHEN